jgi:hypothetical protein
LCQDISTKSLAMCRVLVCLIDEIGGGGRPWILIEHLGWQGLTIVSLISNLWVLIQSTKCFEIGVLVCKCMERNVIKGHENRYKCSGGA